MVKERRLRSKIRVSKSGCMDRCEDGPNVMVFPDCRWYSGVGLEDLDALLEEVAAGLE
jgi:(2Fe-2S) ferredoxin